MSSFVRWWPHLVFVSLLLSQVFYFPAFVLPRTPPHGDPCFIWQAGTVNVKLFENHWAFLNFTICLMHDAYARLTFLVCFWSITCNQWLCLSLGRKGTTTLPNKYVYWQTLTLASAVNTYLVGANKQLSIAEPITVGATCLEQIVHGKTKPHGKIALHGKITMHRKNVAAASSQQLF